MTDSSVNIINIDLDVDDVPVRFKIKLTVRGYEVECSVVGINIYDDFCRNRVMRIKK